jgi:hypothetical protein
MVKTRTHNTEDLQHWTYNICREATECGLGLKDSQVCAGQMKDDTQLRTERNKKGLLKEIRYTQYGGLKRAKEKRVARKTKSFVPF